MRALIASDPRVYREAIADALSKLRPLVEVYRAEPPELEREAERVRPHLILCSRKIDAVALRRAGDLICWTVLYPDGEDQLEIVEVGGEWRRTFSAAAWVSPTCSGSWTRRSYGADWWRRGARERDPLRGIAMTEEQRDGPKLPD